LGGSPDRIWAFSFHPGGKFRWREQDRSRGGRFLGNHAIGYDDDHPLPEIEFVSGDVHRYHFVPRRIWNELRHAPYKGAYFANVIREKFPTARMA
jgi:hypothetical protein